MCSAEGDCFGEGFRLFVIANGIDEVEFYAFSGIDPVPSKAIVCFDPLMFLFECEYFNGVDAFFVEILSYFKDVLLVMSCYKRLVYIC